MVRLLAASGGRATDHRPPHGVYRYTPQVDEAKTFFRYLKSILELKEVANQDIVLIEHTTVWLMEGGLLP